MRVLLLPVNIASDISHKVRSLRNIGVDASGFSIAGSRIQTASEIKIFSINKGNFVTFRVRRAVGFAQMWRMMAWADILHWVGEPNIFDSDLNRKFLRRINKPGVVQWIGSDIRVPEIDFAVNPFYRQAFSEGYEYRAESRKTSQANQRFFASLGFFPLEFIGMGQYIDKELFPETFRTWQSIYLPENEPRFPDAGKTKPLVVHSPSAPVAKGTKYVLQAVEGLKSKYDFDFVLVQNMEREKALEIMSECDVYIDQLILGAHGYAAVEAMAFGKPVVCYINPEIGRDYPKDLPIVNANPETIAEKLEELIGNSELRHKIGRKSREYVETYHDDRRIARDLVELYEKVIDLHRPRGRKV
jgi:glycosyltransferase involved in cell wall biosynthesis